MIHAIDHITLVVSDLDRSIRFYTETLGLTKTGQAHLEGDWIEAVIGIQGVKAEVVYLVPRDGAPRVELLSFQSPASNHVPANSLANTIGMRHLALKVKDIKEMSRQLKEAGVHFLSDPVSIPEDVESGESGKKTLCYFLDPDGILLELAQYS